MLGALPALSAIRVLQPIEQVHPHVTCIQNAGTALRYRYFLCPIAQGAMRHAAQTVSFGDVYPVSPD
jgi:hypothetical protein